AVKSHSMAKLLKAGGGVPLSWGETGNETNDRGLWTPTNVSGGGQPLPWYYSYKAFHDYFAPGTQLYATTVSDPTQVEALASSSKTILINKTATTLTIGVNGVSDVLNPYQVSV